LEHENYLKLFELLYIISWTTNQNVKSLNVTESGQNRRYTYYRSDSFTCHQRVHRAIPGYAFSPAGGLDNPPRGTEGEDRVQITSSLKMYCDTDAITLQGYHIYSHSVTVIEVSVMLMLRWQYRQLQNRVNSNFKAVTINLFHAELFSHLFRLFPSFPCPSLAPLSPLFSSSRSGPANPAKGFGERC